jgi:hypothetical protein
VPETADDDADGTGEPVVLCADWGSFELSLLHALRAAATVKATTAMTFLAGLVEVTYGRLMVMV